MALYKPSEQSPDQAQRINGAVWDAAGPGARIRGWVYPMMTQSTRFDQVNSRILNLDAMTGELTPEQQQAWSEYALANTDQAECLPWDWIEAWLCNNNARADQGLPITMWPPPGVQSMAGAPIQFQGSYEMPLPPWPLLVRPLLVWGDDPSYEPQMYPLWIRATSFNNKPNLPYTASAYTWAAMSQQWPGTSLDLSAILLAARIVCPETWLAVDVRVAWPGAAPSYRQQFTLHNHALD